MMEISNAGKHTDVMTTSVRQHQTQPTAIGRDAELIGAHRSQVDPPTTVKARGFAGAGWREGGFSLASAGARCALRLNSL